jgi:nitroimidazol reductase NimA-like FMN-containing flavoprotein (pyridoxamine 5'-phosphate oxidase superfamily)
MIDPNFEKAWKIIEKILYITIATVSKDGRPWNSPVYSAFDEKYNFYWASWKENQHSKNIRDNNQVFIVIYDSTVSEGTGEGVYIQAKAYELGDEKEIKHALIYLDGRVNKKKDPKTRIAQFQGDKPRRIYKAIPEKVWVNDVGDVNGSYVDTRVEVDLLKK